MVKLLTAEIARELLDYDPETGIVTRKRIKYRRHAGDVVGSTNNKGYLHAYIYDTNYLVHRVIWLMVHGEWPAEQIDHINHVRTDNRLANLRECTNAENRQNIRLEGYGVSGYLGVHSSYKANWIAAITLDGRTKCLGYFYSKETAREAYLKAKLEVHAFVAHDEQLREVAENF